jgi:uncharacterized protein YndB with AHSA1/START domain
MKTIFFFVFLAGLSAFGQTSAPVSGDPAVPTDATQALVIEMSIPAPLPEVWRAFTTREGLSSWLAPDVSVDLKNGGDWLVMFPGSTAGGTIVSFVPERELVISALAPDRFPHVRATRTRAVFTFTAMGNNTVVRLSQTGWHRCRQLGSTWYVAPPLCSRANRLGKNGGPGDKDAGQMMAKEKCYEQSSELLGSPVGSRLGIRDWWPLVQGLRRSMEKGQRLRRRATGRQPGHDLWNQLLAQPGDGIQFGKIPRQPVYHRNVGRNGRLSRRVRLVL